MQVASTLWPDIKSQKISEHRFRLKCTKCSPRTNPNPLKTSRTPVFKQEEAQTSPAGKIEGGWRHWLAGRPAWSADRPVGPTALSLIRDSLGLAHNVSLLRIGSFSPVASCYKYKGVENRTHTRHTHLNTLTSCIVFRLSGV